MNSGGFPQCGQYPIKRKSLTKRGQGRFTVDEALRHQAFEKPEGELNRFDAQAHPAQYPRQLDIQAQVIGRRLKTWRLLDLLDDGFDFA